MKKASSVLRMVCLQKKVTGWGATKLERINSPLKP